MHGSPVKPHAPETDYKMLTMLLNTTGFIPFQLSDVKACPEAAINGNENKITITWDKEAGECGYKITDASKKEVECEFLWARTAVVDHGKLCFLPCCTAGRAVGEVATSVMYVGRYLVELTCDKGSEAMYFDATFSKFSTTFIIQYYIHALGTISPLCDTTSCIHA